MVVGGNVISVVGAAVEGWVGGSVLMTLTEIITIEKRKLKNDVIQGSKLFPITNILSFLILHFAFPPVLYIDIFSNYLRSVRGPFSIQGGVQNRGILGE